MEGGTKVAPPLEGGAVIHISQKGGGGGQYRRVPLLLQVRLSP